MLKNEKWKNNQFQQLVTAQRIGFFKEASLVSSEKNKLNDFSKIDEALMKAL
jgi:hypothetical protein